MKKIFMLLSFLMLVAAVASAELLVTANPLGKGKWGFLGSGIYDSGLQSGTLTGLTLTSFGGYVGYGLTDKLDLFVNGGSANLGGIPATTGGISTAGMASSMTSIGLTAKYLVMNEMSNSPISVAVGAGYKTINSSTTAPTAPSLGGGVTTTANGAQMLVGVGVSKVMVPFIPYGGLTYRSNSSSGTTTSTQIDLTAATAIAWSQQGAVFLEYTLQSITPNGAANYTSGQIGLGVGYSI